MPPTGPNTRRQGGNPSVLPIHRWRRWHWQVSDHRGHGGAVRSHGAIPSSPNNGHVRNGSGKH
ncbi:hypothetical protein K469DRAFT_705787, partial [Zopfia rhizophila CBS 207.26]